MSGEQSFAETSASSYQQTLDRIFAPSENFEPKAAEHAHTLKTMMQKVGGVLDDPSDPFLQAIVAQVDSALSDQATFAKLLEENGGNKDWRTILKEAGLNALLDTKNFVAGAILHQLVDAAYQVLAADPSQAENYVKDDGNNSSSAPFYDGSSPQLPRVLFEKYGKTGSSKQLVFAHRPHVNLYSFRTDMGPAAFRTQK